MLVDPSSRNSGRTFDEWSSGPPKPDAPDVEESRYMTVTRYDATDGGPLC